NIQARCPGNTVLPGHSRLVPVPSSIYGFPPVVRVQIWCNSAAHASPSVPLEALIMATIIQRTNKNGELSFRVQIRRKGAPPLSATFTKLSDARKWVQSTEAAIFEGRHFKVIEAKRHTLADLIDRSIADILPHKGTSSIRKQTQQLLWW